MAALDTASLLARTLAGRDAIRRGAEAYQKSDRQFAPLILWPNRDSLQVWLIPPSIFAGKALGGEHGFIYGSGGTTLVAEVDAFARYRSIELPDTGAVLIKSTESELPLLSEMVLANLLNDAGRSVAIVTSLYHSSLVGTGPGAVWVHIPRP